MGWDDDKSLDDIDVNVEGVDKELDTVRSSLATIDKVADALGPAIATLDKVTDALGPAIATIDTNVDSLLSRTNATIDGKADLLVSRTNATIDSKIDLLGPSIATVDKTVDLLGPSIATVDKTVDLLGPAIATVDKVVDLLGPAIATVDSYVDDLYQEAAHLTYIFPAITGRTVTFTASDTANTWSYWHEITDSSASTLTQRNATLNIHITELQVEDASVTDKHYMTEIGHGVNATNVTVISKHRFISGSTLLPTTQQPRIRALLFDAGNSIYYRQMCETGGSTAVVAFRYHYDYTN